MKLKSFTLLTFNALLVVVIIVSARSVSADSGEKLFDSIFLHCTHENGKLEGIGMIDDIPGVTVEILRNMEWIDISFGSKKISSGTVNVKPDEYVYLHMAEMQSHAEVMFEIDRNTLEYEFGYWMPVDDTGVRRWLTSEGTCRQGKPKI